MNAYLPDVTVEVAFNAGYLTPAADRVWTDVSAYVEADEGISINRGRGDEMSQVQPSLLTLTLDNRDGRFTPGNASGAYYPNVKIGRPVRVRATWGGTTYDRFVGYVTEWPVVWPEATDASCKVTISAASRTARLAAGAELRSIVEEEYLRDSPFAYYPLGEGEGATRASSITGGEVLQVTQRPGTTGGTVEFGAGVGPTTDGLTAPVFTPAATDGLDGKYLRAEMIRTGAPETVLECFFSSSRVRFQPLVALTSQEASTPYMRIVTSATGDLYCELRTDADVSYSINTTGKNYLDGTTYHVLAQVVSGGTLALYVDGALKASSAVPALTLTTTELRVGGYTNAGAVFEGTLAHPAVGDVALTAARVAAHADAGLVGFAAESAPDRIRRLAAYAGVASAEVKTAETGITVAHADTTGRTALDLMQEVEATEAGLLFDDRDGTLVLQPRGHRYNVPLVFAVDAAAQEVEADLEPVLDDQFLVNDVTATDGTVSANAKDPTSIAEYGPRRLDMQIIPANADELVSLVNWQLNRFHEPKVTLRQISIDLLHAPGPTYGSGVYGDGIYGGTAGIADLLAAELGDRFTLAGLPSQAPGSTMSLFVEGIAETITAASYTVSLNVSSNAVSDVWVLDSTTQSQLDSTTLIAL